MGGFFVGYAAVPKVFNTLEEKFVEKQDLNLVTSC